MATPGGEVDPLNSGLGPALATFGGLNSDSDWRLTVSDNFALDTGTFNGWQIRFLDPACYAYPAPQEIPTIDRKGLAAMALPLAAAAALLIWRRRG